MFDRKRNLCSVVATERYVKVLIVFCISFHSNLKETLVTLIQSQNMFYQLA